MESHEHFRRPEIHDKVDYHKVDTSIFTIMALLIGALSIMYGTFLIMRRLHYL